MESSEPASVLEANDINEVAEKLSTSPAPGLSFFLVNSSGQLLRRLGQGVPDFIEVPLPASVYTPGAGEVNAVKFIEHLAESEYRTLVCVLPLFNAEGSPVGLIQAEVRLDETDLALNHLHLLLLRGFGGAFLVACIPWFLLSRSALRLLEQVGRASHRLTLPRAAG